MPRFIGRDSVDAIHWTTAHHRYPSAHPVTTTALRLQGTSSPVGVMFDEIRADPVGKRVRCFYVRHHSCEEACFIICLAPPSDIPGRRRSPACESILHCSPCYPVTMLPCYPSVIKRKDIVHTEHVYYYVVLSPATPICTEKPRPPPCVTLGLVQ